MSSGRPIVRLTAVYLCMRIIVISLGSARMRRRVIEESMSAIGLDFRFFDAFAPDGGLSSVGEFERIDLDGFRLNSLRDPLPGEIGCFASHRAVWRECERLNEPLVVLEDDARPLPGFRRTLWSLDTEMRWLGFVRLESVARRKLKIAATPRAVVTPSGFACLHLRDLPLRATAYALSPVAARRLLAASTVFAAPVDKFLQQVWRHGCPVFATETPVVAPGPEAKFSTIGRRGTRNAGISVRVRRVGHKLWHECRRLRFNRQCATGALAPVTAPLHHAERSPGATAKLTPAPNHRRR